jgi:F-type H+-transporting ATPase subunit c
VKEKKSKMRKLSYLIFALFLLGLLTMPVLAQDDDSSVLDSAVGMKALAMAIAAAGCGDAQSKVMGGAAEGVSRNPGSADTIRFFFILGLAFIEFLALLTFLYVGFF